MQVPAFQCGGKRDRTGRNPVQAAGFRKQMGPEPLPPDGFGAMSGLVRPCPAWPALCAKAVTVLGVLKALFWPLKQKRTARIIFPYSISS